MGTTRVTIWMIRVISHFSGSASFKPQPSPSSRRSSSPHSSAGCKSKATTRGAQESGTHWKVTILHYRHAQQKHTSTHQTAELARMAQEIGKRATYPTWQASRGYQPTYLVLLALQAGTYRVVHDLGVRFRI